jgi:ribosomal protein S18 acetylase RimI-like enzyme
MGRSSSIRRSVYRELEEASLVAWPGLRQVPLDGWVLRASNGYTRRANSVQSLGPSTRALPDKVVDCERWYADARLRCAFRITPFSDARLDCFLDERGYRQEGRSHVMVRELGGADAGAVEELDFPTWIAAYARLSELPATPGALESLLRSIPVQRVHGCVRDPDGRVVSVGLGVLDGFAFGLFDLVTDPAARRRGHGRRLICGLLGWARAHEATHAYLQVLERNDDARRLYARLGFRRAYDYWYRVRPA